MTVLWAGSELEAFIRTSSSVVESGTAGLFNSTFARGAIFCPWAGSNSNLNTPSTEYFETPGTWLDGVTVGSTDTVWMRYNHRVGSFGGYFSWNILYDASGPVFRLLGSTGTGGNLFFQYSTNSGSSFTNVGNFNVGNGTLYEMVIMITLGASGRIKMWLGDTNQFDSGTINLSGISTISKARFQCTSFSGGDYYSSIIITKNEDPRNWQLYVRPPTGNGTNTAATGTFADVDELVLDDTDSISFAANGDKETYTYSSLTVPGGYDVVGVVVSSRVRKGASGIANYQHVVRSAGTDYASSSVTALDTAYGPRQSIWTTDPATSSAWTAAPSEFGGKGIT